MCGIFGVFTNAANGFTDGQISLLSQSAVINQFRGTDSTGVMVIDSDNKSSLLKVLGGAGSLFNHGDWEPLRKTIWTKGRIVVGHGRSATRGTVKLENAHPFAKTFETGEVLKLVHNGTLDYYQDLPDFHKFDVDSEWIAEMLVRYGPKDALSQIRGAMALVWWNEKEKTINFFRNDDRPLHFNKYIDKHISTFLLASEAAAVKFLGERNGLITEEAKTEVFYFSPNVHYALHADDLFGNWATYEKYPKPKERPVITYVPTVFGDYYSRRDPIKTDERSYTTDIDKIKSDVYRSVTFVQRAPMTKPHQKDWVRITAFPGGGTITDIGVIPYIYGLRKMERAINSASKDPNQEFVRIDYDSDNGKPYTTWLAIPEQSILVPNDWKDDSYYKGFIDVGIKKFSPGRKVKWASKSGGKIIRHEGYISDQGGAALKKYSNSVEGDYELGSSVEVEVTSMEKVELKGRSYWKLEGSELKSPTPVSIDICAYIPDTPENIKYFDIPSEYYPFLAGKISKIELATEMRNKETFAQVVFILTDLKMLYDEDMANFKKEQNVKIAS